MAGVQRVSIVDPVDETREQFRNMLLSIDTVYLEADCTRYEFFLDVVGPTPWMYVNAMTTRLLLGMSTPRTLGIPALRYLPCRCLWRGLVQITRTTPNRRTIRQFSQMRLTDALTFMINASAYLRRDRRCGPCSGRTG